MGAKIIAFTNQKGGVGKTTLAIQLSGAIARAKKNVLLIDLDPQGHLSSFFIEDIYQLKTTIRDVLVNDIAMSKIIQTTRIKNIALAPANITLADLDSKLAGDDDAQYLLRDALDNVNSRYDYIVIDCPPFLGKATRMALVSSTHFIVPIEAHKWAVKGAGQLLSYVDAVRKRANPNLQFLGLVINKLMGKRRLEADMKKVLSDNYDAHLFQTEFKNMTIYSESNSKGKMLAFSKSPEGQMIVKLFEEIQARV